MFRIYSDVFRGELSFCAVFRLIKFVNELDQVCENQIRCNLIFANLLLTFIKFMIKNFDNRFSASLCRQPASDTLSSTRSKRCERIQMYIGFSYAKQQGCNEPASTCTFLAVYIIGYIHQQFVSYDLEFTNNMFLSCKCEQQLDK